MNIRQTLLQDAEEPKLQGARKARETLGHFQFNFDTTAFGKALDIPFGGRCEADFIKKRRVQQMGNRARFRNGLVEKLDGAS